MKLKQIQLSYNIAKGDLETKLRHAKKHLDAGCRVKLEMKLKGRQNVHTDIGLQKMQEAVTALTCQGLLVERPPLLNGNMIIAQLRMK